MSRMDFSIPLSIDVDADAYLASAGVSISVFLIFFAIIAAVLVAFHFLDRWLEDRNSPVGRLTRRHFGGV